MAPKLPGLTGMFAMTTSLQLGRWGIGLLEKTTENITSGCMAGIWAEIWDNLGNLVAMALGPGVFQFGYAERMRNKYYLFKSM